jgi:hypothetical protein
MRGHQSSGLWTWAPCGRRLGAVFLLDFTRADVAVVFLVGERPLDPAHGLGFEILVAEEFGERIESVDPVGAALPGVAVAAEPSVAGAADFRIPAVEVAGHALGHALEFIEQPGLGFDRSEREFRVGFFSERGAVEDGFGGADRSGGEGE